MPNNSLENIDDSNLSEEQKPVQKPERKPGWKIDLEGHKIVTSKRVFEREKMVPQDEIPKEVKKFILVDTDDYVDDFSQNVDSDINLVTVFDHHGLNRSEKNDETATSKVLDTISKNTDMQKSLGVAAPDSMQHSFRWTKSVRISMMSEIIKDPNTRYSKPKILEKVGVGTNHIDVDSVCAVYAMRNPVKATLGDNADLLKKISQFSDFSLSDEAVLSWTFLQKDGNGRYLKDGQGKYLTEKIPIGTNYEIVQLLNSYLKKTKRKLRDGRETILSENEVLVDFLKNFEKILRDDNERNKIKTDWAKAVAKYNTLYLGDNSQSEKIILTSYKENEPKIFSTIGENKDILFLNRDAAGTNAQRDNLSSNIPRFYYWLSKKVNTDVVYTKQTQKQKYTTVSTLTRSVEDLGKYDFIQLRDCLNSIEFGKKLAELLVDDENIYNQRIAAYPISVREEMEKIRHSMTSWNRNEIYNQIFKLIENNNDALAIGLKSKIWNGRNGLISCNGSDVSLSINEMAEIIDDWKNKKLKMEDIKKYIKVEDVQPVGEFGQDLAA